MKKKAGIWFLYFFLLVFSASSVSALSMPSLISDAASWLNRPYFVLFIVFTMFFVLLYGIFAAALGFAKAFSKEGGGRELTKNGRIVAVSMAMISTFGIFGYGYATGGVMNMLERLPIILGTFGTIAAWTISALMAVLIFFMYKDLPLHQQEGGMNTWMRLGLTSLCFGSSMWIFGSLMSKMDFMDFGITFIVLGVILILIGIVPKRLPSGSSAGNPGGSSSGGGSPGPSGSGNPDASGIRNAVDDGINAINDAAQNASGEIKDSAEKARNDMESLRDDIKSLIKDAGEQMKSSMDDTLGKYDEKLKNSADEASEDAAKKIKEAGDSMHEALQKLNEANQTADENIQDLRNAIREAKQAIEDALRKAGGSEDMKDDTDGIKRVRGYIETAEKKILMLEDLRDRSSKDIKRLEQKEAKKLETPDFSSLKSKVEDVRKRLDDHFSQSERITALLGNRELLDKKYINKDMMLASNMQGAVSELRDLLKRITQAVTEIEDPKQEKKTFPRKELKEAKKKLDFLKGNSAKMLSINYYRNERRESRELNKLKRDAENTEGLLIKIQSMFSHLFSKLGFFDEELRNDLSKEQEIVGNEKRHLNKLKEIIISKEKQIQDIKSLRSSLKGDIKDLDSLLSKKGAEIKRSLKGIESSANKISENLGQILEKFRTMMELIHYATDLDRVIREIDEHLKRFNDDALRRIEMLFSSLNKKNQEKGSGRPGQPASPNVSQKSIEGNAGNNLPPQKT